MSEQSDGIFQTGLMLPIISTCVIARKSNDEVDNIEIINIKEQIKNMRNARTKIYLSDLIRKLNVSPLKVKKAVDELVNEGFLKPL